MTTGMLRPIGMADEAVSGELPGGFYFVDASRAAVLERELAREILPGHRVAGRRLKALAERVRDDDVLFAEHRDDGSSVHWLIHLTWSRAVDPRWPDAAIDFPSGLRRPFDDA